MSIPSSRLLFFFSVIAVFVCALMLFNVAPKTAEGATTSVAKTPLEYSGWIPYWRTATGTQDVLPHVSQLKEVNPFGYTVKQDGSLYDAAGLEDPASRWSALIAAARAKKVRVIPTVMWSDTASIHKVLSDKTLRSKHVDAIVAMVSRNNFDGVDIDYEGKLADDKDNYSAFLKELYAKMGKKWVMCTIEARTPVDSRYLSTPPADATTYANDLVAINKYCDRVKLMTYDQDRIDLKLNAAHADTLYSPISDPAWVTKVVNLMSKDIRKSKLVLGVATYGYIYQVIPNSDGSGYSYSLLEAFNPKYATDLAKSLNITPVRSPAGELTFSYVPKELSNVGLPAQSTVSSYAPSGTPSALLAAVGAAKLVQAQSKQAPFYMLTWSDSKAIADKVALARKLGLRGVAVFKFDGGEDPAMWSVLK